MFDAMLTEFQETLEYKTLLFTFGQLGIDEETVLNAIYSKLASLEVSSLHSVSTISIISSRAINATLVTSQQIYVLKIYKSPASEIINISLSGDEETQVLIIQGNTGSSDVEPSD